MADLRHRFHAGAIRRGWEKDEECGHDREAKRGGDSREPGNQGTDRRRAAGDAGTGTDPVAGAWESSVLPEYLGGGEEVGAISGTRWRYRPDERTTSL